MFKLVRLYTTSSKVTLIVLILGAAMIFWLGIARTNAQSPVTVLKTGEAKKYEELQFATEQGIQYTLQNSQNLSNWKNDLTFIGNGELVKLRLFALNDNVLPQNGNDDPYSIVSGSIRKVSTGGTSISWISLEDQSIKHAFFPAIELENSFPHTYSGLKGGYYLFINLGPPDAVIDPDSPVVGKDLAFKNSLPSLFSDIKNDTLAGATPLRPHRLIASLTKQFWRINTDPDIDSDGDAIPDRFEISNDTDPYDGDTDNDGVSDQLPPVIDVGVDSDSDGLTDSEEELLGTNPNNSDTDGDTLIDGNDADPLDAAIVWLRASESSYIVSELELPAGFDLSIVNNDHKRIHIDLGESGHVLLSITDESTFWNQSEPKGVPDASSYKTAVWQPTTGLWENLSMPDNMRATAVLIDPAGNVHGHALLARGAEESGPGVKRVRVRWKKLTENSGWKKAHSELGAEGGEDFSNEQDTYTLINDIHVNKGLDDALFGETGRFVGFAGQNGDANDIGYIQRAEKENTIGTPITIFDFNGSNNLDHIELDGDPSGWHTAIWKKDGNSDLEPPIFGKLIEAEGQTSGSIVTANTPTGDSLKSLSGIASIDPGYLPEGVSELIIWANEKDGFLSAKVAGSDYNNLEWKASDKPDQTQSLNPPSPSYIPGNFATYETPKINSRGEALKGNKLWRNGKWHELADLIPSLAESNFQALDLNNEGTILILQEGKLKQAKLSYQPKWWDGSIPFFYGARDSHPSDISLADLTPHTKEYSASLIVRGLDAQRTILTVDGGAIDIGHVRHNMDRTLSFYYQLCKRLKKVNVIKRGTTTFKSNINDEDYYADVLGKKKKVKAVFAFKDLTRKDVTTAAYDMAMLEAKFYEDSSINKGVDGRQETPAMTRKHDSSFWTIDDRPSDHLGAKIARDFLATKPFDYVCPNS